MTRPPFDRSRFRRLLGMYVLGVAIGCLLVGMMLNMKKYFRPPAPAGPPASAGTAPSEATPAPRPDGIAPGEPAAPAPAGS